MKERQGFVSNSSSSSYIVIARKATIDEIDNPKVRISLGYGGDGEYYGRPSAEIIRWMKDNRENYEYNLYYEYFSAPSGAEIEDNNDVDFTEFANILLTSKGVGAAIYAKEVDYHFPEDNLDYFKDLIQLRSRW